MLALAAAAAAVLPTPPTLVGLSTAEGALRLSSQPSTSAAWNLLAHFETQRTQSFCSIATAAIMLNAVGAPAPIDPVFAPYPYFTQANVLGACALKSASHAGDALSAGFVEITVLPGLFQHQNKRL